MLTGAVKNYFIDTLRKGEYSLLLGAGVSLDSENTKNNKMLSGENLKKTIAKLYGVPEITPLTKLAKYLDPDEKKEILTDGYKTKKYGRSCTLFPNYLWKTIYTFNIDDVVETIYSESKDKKQSLSTINFKDRYTIAKTPSNLQIIHLHGYVNKPDDGYVFSINEYIDIIDEINPWMTLMADSFLIDPFIIAGASINETDFEYYIKKRKTGRSARSNAPSLLIEPYPNIITEKECKDNNILLVKSTIEDFMAWVYSELPITETVEDLMINKSFTFVNDKYEKSDALQFSIDFEKIVFEKKPMSQNASIFFFGSEPTVNDINQNLDIERRNIFSTYTQIMANIDTRYVKLFIISDESFTGKSTYALRVLEKLAANNYEILRFLNPNRIDISNAKKMLPQLKKPLILWVDNIADRMNEVNDILNEDLDSLFVIGACRDYRFQLVKDTAVARISEIKPSLFTRSEYISIIENYRHYGLIGDSAIIASDGASLIERDPVGVAICRIMKDFRPLESIISEIIRDSKLLDLAAFLAVSISQYCYSTGLPYRIFERMSTEPINYYINSKIPLKLRYSNDQKFVLAQNEAISIEVLNRTAKENNDLVFSIMVKLANALSTYVNRGTFSQQIPEARIARRLLNYQDVIKNFIGGRVDDFYFSIQKKWEWNSRYWEQRSLSLLKSNIDDALRYAKNAISIERHPFTLNTYSTVLHELMKRDNDTINGYFQEILSTLEEAMSKENKNRRITVYPLTTLLTSTLTYLHNGSTLSEVDAYRIDEMIKSVEEKVYIEAKIKDMIKEIRIAI